MNEVPFWQSVKRGMKIVQELRELMERNNLNLEELGELFKQSETLKELYSWLPKSLPADVTVQEEDLSIKKAVAVVEKDLILKAIKKTEGSRIRAAKLLGISHRTLLFKIKGYGLLSDK